MKHKERTEKYWSLLCVEAKPVYCDEYGFLTKKSVYILKKHGNLVIDLDVFKGGMSACCKKHFKKKLFDPKTIETCPNYAEMLEFSRNSLMTVCGRLVGFKCVCKTLVPDRNWAHTTILIEREGSFDGQ